MKFSEKWLREWVSPKITTAELIEKLTLAGLEVDDSMPCAGEFSGVIVAEIKSCEPHPDADKLNVCQVFDGKKDYQVVCGAPNARAGIKIPFATVGAVLPSDFKIKQAKLRGVESNGMLCAEAELGLSEASDGLMELASDAPVGECLRDYLNLDDTIIDIDLTPNRGDCLSIKGLARETGVLTQVDVSAPAIKAESASTNASIDVEVSAPKACPVYLARVIKGINIQAPSPLWLTEKLRRSGIRSIDAIVDITNYVMLELGQPMHAFDLDKINDKICVRMANKDEPITLLDGQEIKLNDNTLVIADAQKTLAIAGVMGGEDSGVSNTTQDIVLEAAFFEPVALAGQARSYGLHTDSSHRFERGVDFKLPQQAIERATELVLQLCGGQAGEVVEHSSKENLPELNPILLRRARIAKILGKALDDAEVNDVLTRLGFMVAEVEEGWQVTSTSYRYDIRIEEDLLEELARVHGYDNFPVTTPLLNATIKAQPERELPQRFLRRLLMARGYQEAITYSFVEPKAQQLLEPDVKPEALLNPISVDMSVMRTSLWTGLLNAASYNLKRQQSRVRLFEIGLRFIPGEQLQQIPTLAMLLCGDRLPQSWADKSEPVDFYDLKGDFASLLAQYGLESQIEFRKAVHPALHPGQSAQLYRDDKLVGWIGALHPSLHKSLGVKGGAFLLEVDLESIISLDLPDIQPLSKHPEARRDLAFIVKQETTLEQMQKCITEHAGEYFKQVNLFDQYIGAGVDEGHKSLALGLTWQHPSRTLTDEEINEPVANLVQALNTEIGAILRDS